MFLLFWVVLGTLSLAKPQKITKTYSFVSHTCNTNKPRVNLQGILYVVRVFFLVLWQGCQKFFYILLVQGVKLFIAILRTTDSRKNLQPYYPQWMIILKVPNLISSPDLPVWNSYFLTCIRTYVSRSICCRI